MAEYDEPNEKGGEWDNKEPSGEGEDNANRKRSGFVVDTRYPRSIEGILRAASLPFTVVFFILMVVAGGGIGGWNGFVSIGWIIYVVIVFVVEVFVPEFYVHRLIDAIIAIVYAVVFAVAVLICIIFAAITTVTAAKGLLAAGVIFGAICCGIVSASAAFALYTWRTHEGGTKGSRAIIFI